MRTPRTIPFVPLLLAAGLCLPASAQVGGAGGERKNDTQETRRGTGGTGGTGGGGVRPAGQEQRGDQTGGTREQAGDKQRDGQRDNEQQGGRGRGGETPPPTPEGETPAQERERPIEEKRPTPEGERPVPAGQGQGTREQPGRGQGTGQPGNDKGQGAERSANRTLSRAEIQKFMGMLASEESLHREHQAKLRRLMEIARTEKDEQRLADVQALAQREGERHQREIDKMERYVGSENFRIGVQKMKQHYERRKQAGAGDEGERSREERPAGERKGDAREEPAGGDGAGTGGGRRGGANQGGGGR